MKTQFKNLNFLVQKFKIKFCFENITKYKREKEKIQRIVINTDGDLSLASLLILSF